MRIIDLKKLFISDHRYDWEADNFIKISLKLLNETKSHKFYESSPSKEKNSEDLLSQLAKENNLL